MLTAVADVLIDAALVLGGDATLRILYVKLVEVRTVFFDAVRMISTVCLVFFFLIDK